MIKKKTEGSSRQNTTSAYALFENRGVSLTFLQKFKQSLENGDLAKGTEIYELCGDHDYISSDGNAPIELKRGTSLKRTGYSNSTNLATCYTLDGGKVE